MSYVVGKYLPPELVELILKRLDGNTLIASRRVCKTWCEIVDRLSKETNIWEVICHQNLDIYKPIIDKGYLSWMNAYINFCLWKKIDRAHITKSIVGGFDSSNIPIRDMNTTKGELCLTLYNKIMIYDASSLQNNQTITGQYLSYVQNAFMTIIYSDNKCLYLKTNFESQDEKIVIEKVECFRLNEDKCFYLTSQQHFGVCFLKNNCFAKPEILSKWYHSDRIREMVFYDGNVYFLTFSGKHLIYQFRRFIQINSFVWPSFEYTTFQIFYICRGRNLIYCNDAYLYVCLENGDSATYETIRQITCIMLHGNILFIGTHWGEILIYAINEIEDLLNLILSEPLDQHFLANEVSQPILGFDIYEENGCHTLFIRTRSNIFYVKYDHFSEKDVSSSRERKIYKQYTLHPSTSHKWFNIS